MPNVVVDDVVVALCPFQNSEFNLNSGFPNSEMSNSEFSVSIKLIFLAAEDPVLTNWLLLLSDSNLFID